MNATRPGDCSKQSEARVALALPDLAKSGTAAFRSGSIRRRQHCCHGKWMTWHDENAGRAAAMRMCSEWVERNKINSSFMLLPLYSGFNNLYQLHKKVRISKSPSEL